jgi:magnesium-transporting ATPase (P-type)
VSGEVLQRLESSATGLTTEEAQKRLARYGPNAIPEIRTINNKITKKAR